MKLSIVIAVLNSHEMVRRQLLYFVKMRMPEYTEIVIVDDGSNPPLIKYYNEEIAPKFTSVLPLIFYVTDNFDEWTQPMARNLGVARARGEMVLCTDIDHIIPKETIDFVINNDFDVVRFRRFVGTLDENGEFKDDFKTLREYGFNRNRKRISAHGNSYAIRRGLFLGLGGSRQKDTYPNRDEVPLKSKIRKLARKGKIKVCGDERRPKIYMVPNGRFCGEKNYNPFGLFHNLKR